MPRLSIVIPALGAWEQLEATLVSVLGNRPGDSEVIVALGQGYDDPYGLEGEVRFVRLPPAATTVDAWNAAIAACDAPVVHLLACGATVVEGWCDTALRHFDESRVAAVAPLLTDLDGRHLHTAGWQYSAGGAATFFAAGRPADSPLEPDSRWMGPHGAAAFYRRSALASASTAFDRSLGEEMAPLDLALRLRQAGYRAVLEPRCRVAIANLPRAMPLSSCAAERLFWRHAANDGILHAAIAHIGAVSLEFAQSFPRVLCVRQLAGRTAGLITPQRSSYADYCLAPFVDEEVSEAFRSGHRFHPAHQTFCRSAKRRPTIAHEARSERHG